MYTTMTFIKKHPVLIYFMLVFAISWGAFLALVGPPGIPGKGDELGRLMPPVYLLMVASTSVSGLLLTGIVGGRAGLSEFRSRLFRWRVGAHWYAVALLTTPLLATGTLLVLSLTSRDFLPLIYTTDDKAFVLQFGVVVGLLVGIFEELGWTGFAIPKLRRRNGILATGLIVGFAEGAWHLLVVIWTNGDSMGGISPILFLFAVLFTWLPAYRVLMVYIYDRTESLLVAILMHTSLIAFWYILTPHVLTGLPLVAYYLVFTAAVCVVIAVVSWMRTLPRQGRSSLPVQG